QLPPIEKFYSELLESGISEEDYQHAENVWEVFNMSNFGEYHDVYLATDTLLLADIFENFRKMCLESYELDPAHRFTSPGIAWLACLKMTGVVFQLLTDPDMALMIERGIRGGICSAFKRF